MKLIEEKGDLFKVDDKYYLAHCISDDFAMGAGIAVEFQKRFKLRHKLFEQYPQGLFGVGCIQTGRIFNLITKEKYWHKPTINSLQRSIIDMKKMIIEQDIKYLAMPKIGSGLDRLQWNEVKSVIEDVFQDADIEILVRHL